MANQLLSWADRLASRPVTGPDLSDEHKRELTLAMAAASKEIRRRRSQIFPGVRLAEPMWDIMLDLFIQEENGFRVSLDHLALSGELEAPIVHHGVNLLTQAGLVRSTADRFDRRVVWLSLSPEGKVGMVELLLQSASFDPPIADVHVPWARAAD